MMFVDIQLLLC